jgi:hypothetical protein
MVLRNYVYSKKRVRYLCPPDACYLCPSIQDPASASREFNCDDDFPALHNPVSQMRKTASKYHGLRLLLLLNSIPEN